MGMPKAKSKRMTRSNLCIDGRILAAVQSVWSDAAQDGPGTAIVPLHRLVANYPIWVSEIENLSIERASNYISEKTGQKPELGLESHGSLSGFFYAYLYQGTFVGCILVEKQDKVERRRFSVAHELGHYKLHFEPWLDQLEPDQKDQGILITDAMIYAASTDETTNELTAGTGNALPVREGQVTQGPAIFMSEKQEAEANQFAASLLMPENILRERMAGFHLRAGQPRGYLASLLASEFLVSKEAMVYRLATLAL
jgi:Zn-dependent peptidase ImmA (M78 family)